MATRTVTGPILGPIDNLPLTDFKLKFTVTKRADGTVQYTDDGHYPWHEVEIVTDTNGDFALDMMTGITYAVQFTGAIQDDGRVKSYPPGVGSSLEFVVPDGPGSISLQTIRALGSVKPDDPSVADIIANAINEYMANNGVADAVDTINSHVADTDNPHGVTAAQAGAYTTSETDNLLSAKADTSSLGTAAAANVGDFATAAQGGKADTAVQPSTGLTEAIAQRHEHTNKAVLDTVATSTLVPPGGLRGQVLTMGETGRTWQDVPGIVYPSLLLSPDGSFDRNGPVTPTEVGDVQVVDGRWVSNTTGSVSAPMAGLLMPNRGAVLLRLLIPVVHNVVLMRIGTTVSGDCIQIRTDGTSRQLRCNYKSGSNWGGGVNLPPGLESRTIMLDWDGLSMGVSDEQGRVFNPTARVAPTGAFNAPVTLEVTNTASHAGMLLYPEPLSSRVFTTLLQTDAWTMENTALNLYQPQSAFSLFAPNRAIASGGTTLRTAPGASAPTITTLSASTLVESSGTIVNAGGVGYTLIRTQGGHQGYTPSTALAPL